MSDRELEALKQKRLQEMQKKMRFQEQSREPTDANAVLNGIFEGRAWEVFNAASLQFPSEMAKIKHLMVQLSRENKIKGMDGEQLYIFLKEIGLPVRLNTTIKVLSRGKAKSISEKFKESTK